MKVDSEELKRIAGVVSRSVEPCHMLNEEDIYAAAMVGAWQGFMSYKPESAASLKTWMKRKAFFEVKDERRRVMGREHSSDRNYGALDESLDAMIECGFYKPSKVCEGLAEVESVDAMNFILRETYVPRARVSLFLHHVHGVFISDISRYFGVTEGAISRQMALARERLADVLRHTPASASCGTL